MLIPHHLNPLGLFRKQDIPPISGIGDYAPPPRKNTLFSKKMGTHMQPPLAFEWWGGGGGVYIFCNLDRRLETYSFMQVIIVNLI